MISKQGPREGLFHFGGRYIVTRLLLAIAMLALATAPSAAEKIGAFAVATANPLATETGISMLRSGGNAFDAAVAIAATLSVVEPVSCGLGGGGFWLLHRAKDGADIFIDAREAAPAAAHRDMYLDPKGNVIPNLSLDGPLAAAIPGTPAALAHISKRFGKLPLSQALAPAIHFARGGYKVESFFNQNATSRLAVLQRWPGANFLLVEGHAPAPGYTLKQPDLAVTLEAIAKSGAIGFYTGRIATQLVDGVRNAGGIWTLDDLAKYQLKEREPVRGQFGPLKIVSAPPPSSGGITLIEALNIIQGVQNVRLETPLGKHVIVEALRRAYRDRAEYLGDPDFILNPTQKLLSSRYADGLRASIQMDRATPSASLPRATDSPQGMQTTHFSVVDADGNRVAATFTLNQTFGSGFVPPGTGVILNNEMDDFSAKPGVPNSFGLVGAAANAIAPRKRPLSSMAPTFVDGPDGFAILGTPGGSRIISMVLLGILEYARGGDAEAIVGAPRFHHQYLPDTVVYEEGALTLDDVAALEQRGHLMEPAAAPYGNMQVVVWKQKTHSITVASDPRGHGSATTTPAHQKSP